MGLRVIRAEQHGWVWYSIELARTHATDRHQHRNLRASKPPPGGFFGAYCDQYRGLEGDEHGMLGTCKDDAQLLDLESKNGSKASRAAGGRAVRMPTTRALPIRIGTRATAVRNDGALLHAGEHDVNRIHVAHRIGRLRPECGGCSTANRRQPKLSSLSDFPS
jgi:hypothetical protein